MQRKQYGFATLSTTFASWESHIDAVLLYIDSNSALKLTRNPEFHSKSKYIDVKHHFIREKVEEDVINTQRVDTKDNLADVFTKALPRPTHEDLADRLNLVSGGDGMANVAN
jgi:hypothetical protein